jgi:riboflavin kinase/FMN adenylyltransferase
MRYKGVVQTGQKRGQELGFPTINIPLEDKEVRGIFAAKVFIGKREYPAAVYADVSRKILEAHMLDFSDLPAQADDLYGKEIEIELLQKIRDDEKFDDEAELKAAIASDVAKVREYFIT